ncbi:GIN domain-containing protein [Pedobacter cryoconitis]|uniref:Putative auto-transporter adhesin head GIN domain-containing protein n=1 Tax=Pedobacter cryoconitis TaxID=188932 RepID=A0A7X0MKI5_9SPHI|nr:DUF2807 domain-containing protein [Pedobacter cryoconitis]MBB6502234.1 hypothetical protein [Pedobacter cryoconitis]
MKTSLKTVLTLVMTAILLTATVITSTAAERIITLGKESANPDIKRVVIKGNVQVRLVQSQREWVSLDEDNMSKVKIKQNGNILNISSSEKNPVSVTVYVKDIYRIEASDKANITTIGKFNLKFLQVILKDNAVAFIKADTEGLYTQMDGQSKLQLLGSTVDHYIKNSGNGMLNTAKFAAVNTENLPGSSRLAMNTDGMKHKKMNVDTLKK